MVTFWHKTIYRVSTNWQALAPFIYIFCICSTSRSRADTPVLEIRERLAGLFTYFLTPDAGQKHQKEHRWDNLRKGQQVSRCLRSEDPHQPNAGAGVWNSKFSKMIMNIFITTEIGSASKQSSQSLALRAPVFSDSLWNNLCFLDKQFFFVFGNVFKTFGTLT